MLVYTLQNLEETLANSAFLRGDCPSAEDSRVFKELSLPEQSIHPNLFGWYSFVQQFSDAVRAAWPASQVSAVTNPAGLQPVENDSFDDDLFGEDENAAEEAKIIAKTKVAGKKEEPAGKSSVVFDVKPVSTTVDLDGLAGKIFAEVRMDGLVFGKEYRKEKVAFTVSKLVIGCTILDTVETDGIIEKIMELKGEIQVEEEDEDGEGTGVVKTVNDVWVQSVDIVSFQRV
jgi:translation elongation factor EF-1beta